jgi:dolichol-phosphate mannosyltransferase
MEGILIVLPIYNEVENIRNVYNRIRKNSNADILFVDDGSTDGSINLVSDLILADSRIKLILRGSKLGLGSAYRDSYKFALENNYSFLIQCDADGSHEIEKIPEMMQAAESGADLVIGSRYVSGGSVKGWAKSRQVISRIGNLYSRLMLGLTSKDNTAGFRIYNLETLAKLNYENAKANGYAFQVQMTYLFRTKKIVEIPICFVERQYGASKMTTKIALEALIQIPLLRFAKN